ncbi:hypothetical protein CEUSTIGMA_g7500.t1 [Chlamydomonas eustigma]|uniref:Uncharacterized protein n=1 Tax=Chlamydomonas eustigma TaxID=1157962 RepID=A0A250XAE4_9CHLO|nr:hypothetical protein CEUSTIGMA_g7500.t1 [Chlamydomonas eustigma]|eukprot:GAX80061.1 hypothetical protein CEUSTIGMA_g7500.t1 [Chlamydomonas eustigma]
MNFLQRWRHSTKHHGQLMHSRYCMWILVVTSCIVTVALVFLEFRTCRDDADGDRKNKRFERGMTEKEYTMLIPEDELHRVRKIIKKACKFRGWSGSPGDIEKAWLHATSAAKGVNGGSWSDHFVVEDLDESRLEKLCNMIDDVFLGGQLQKELYKRRVGRLKFSVDDDPRGQDDWISYFGEDSVIHFLRRKWSQSVSESQPMICEGILCHTRLQLLMHTLAHEMVHALVFHLLPDIDKASLAYLPDERHGPIFKLLNKRLFGHPTDSYKKLFGGF